jgi:hypothetical protein
MPPFLTFAVAAAAQRQELPLSPAHRGLAALRERLWSEDPCPIAHPIGEGSRRPRLLIHLQNVSGLPVVFQPSGRQNRQNYL